MTQTTLKRFEEEDAHDLGKRKTVFLLCPLQHRLSIGWSFFVVQQEPALLTSEISNPYIVVVPPPEPWEPDLEYYSQNIYNKKMTRKTN